MSARIGSLVPRVMLIFLGSALVIEIAVAVTVVGGSGDLGVDFRFYRDSAARWLAGDGFYLPHQLAGPYKFTTLVDVVYPPIALYLFVPFTMLPALLWWAIPIGVLSWLVLRWRPGYLTLCVLIALLLPARAFGAYLWGNTDIWGVAAVAGGLRWGWPAAMLAFKPTVLPLAIVGVRDRRFWRGVAAVVLASLPFAAMWVDYATVVRNLDRGIDYSLGSLSLYMVPVVAWASDRWSAREVRVPRGMRLMFERTAAALGGRRDAGIS